MLRFPDGMRDRVKAAAEANKRSMNAEIVHRLDETFEAFAIEMDFAAGGSKRAPSARARQRMLYAEMTEKDLLEFVRDAVEQLADATRMLEEKRHDRERS